MRMPTPLLLLLLLYISLITQPSTLQRCALLTCCCALVSCQQLCQLFKLCCYVWLAAVLAGGCCELAP
jgi:hypothetical protein